jgi:oxygen-independent coproporphyrinogen-3 oxidase
MAGVYIHIPFCKQACTYCDFHFTTSFKYTDEMVAAICTEIELKKSRINEPIGSIYFGGGTPSVLSSALLGKIFTKLTQCFDIKNDAEITLEANPDDLEANKLADLRKLPINRFSIGLQSFFNEDLVWMNRAHNATQAESCIKRSQDAGFENLSLDLIYGYPLLTNEKWIANMDKAIELGVPHISAYALTVESKTALAYAIRKGKQIGLSDEQSATQFLMLSERLSDAGFDHYEISNYGLPSQHAVHNTNYWKGVPYLGIGPSAHGFDGAFRYLNIANNAMYLTQLTQNKLAETIEELSIEDQFNEYIMTSLRTMWGINLSFVKNQFGDTYLNELLQEVKPFIAKEQLLMNDDQLILTQKGKLFADGIAAELFVLNE